MAATRGADGKICMNTSQAIACIDSWTLNGEIGTAEITAYGDSAKKFGATVRSFTANISGSLDRSDTDQADLLLAFEGGTSTSIEMGLQLHTSSVHHFTLTALVNNFTINSQVADKVGFTASFIGNSTLGYVAV